MLDRVSICVVFGVAWSEFSTPTRPATCILQMARTKAQAFRSPSLTGNNQQYTEPQAKRGTILTHESTPPRTITARMCFMAFLSSKKFPSQSHLHAKGWNDALYEGATGPDLDLDPLNCTRDERWYTASLILREKPHYLPPNAYFTSPSSFPGLPNYLQDRDHMLQELFLPSPTPSPALKTEPIVPASPPPPSPVIERTVSLVKTRPLTRATNNPYVYKPKATQAVAESADEDEPEILPPVIKRRPGRPPGARNKNALQPESQTPAVLATSEHQTTSSPAVPVRVRRRTMDREMHETLNLIRHIEADSYMEGRPKRRKLSQPNYNIDTSSPPASERTPLYTRGSHGSRRKVAAQNIGGIDTRGSEEEWDPDVEEVIKGGGKSTMDDQTNARGHRLVSKATGRPAGTQAGRQNSGPGSLIGVILERRPRGRPRRSTVPEPVENTPRSTREASGSFPLTRSSSSGNVPLSLMADCILEPTHPRSASPSQPRTRRDLVVDGKYDPGSSSFSSIASDSPPPSNTDGPTASSSHTTIFTSPSIQLPPVPKTSSENNERFRARSASMAVPDGLGVDTREVNADAVAGGWDADADEETVEAAMEISDPEVDVTSHGEETEDEGVLELTS